MKVAVTGAAGFLGTNLVNQLVEDGHDVTGVDRVRSEQAPEQVKWVLGDVLDRDAMVRALDGAELVYHLIAMITLAQHDEKAWTVNTAGVRTVAEAARTVGVRRMVHCSSVHSFDQYTLEGELDENTPRSTASTIPVYDRSKWAGEQELRTVIGAGLDAVICNPTGVYGPVDYGPSRINGMLRDAARGWVPAVIGGGFDLVDVRDVAHGLIAASEHGRTGENYLLNGEMITILQACRQAAAVEGRRGPRFAIPLSLITPILPLAEPIATRFGSDMVSRAAMGSLLAAPIVNGTKARTELGYQPRPAGDTIRDVVEFFRASGKLDTRRQRRRTGSR